MRTIVAVHLGLVLGAIGSLVAVATALPAFPHRGPAVSDASNDVSPPGLAPSCPARSSEDSPTIEVWFAEGCDREYPIGAHLHLYYRASVTDTARVWREPDHEIFVQDWLVPGVTYEIEGPVTGPPGAYWIFGELLHHAATATCYYTSTMATASPTSATSTPTSPPSPTREPLPPSGTATATSTADTTPTPDTPPSATLRSTHVPLTPATRDTWAGGLRICLPAVLKAWR